MKRFPYLFLSFLLASCSSNDSSHSVVSQQFVHKYGFDLSEKEWEEREKEGQIVCVLKNGVQVTRSYENGQLHGSTLYTFPHSTIVEKLQMYDQGTLLKEVLHDVAGVPMREDAYEFDDRTVITLWDEKGAPISIEEYDQDLLLEAKYYTPDHELEGQVTNGFGTRIKRERGGLLISRDSIESGLLCSRTNYHPNGQIHSISQYVDDQLHGHQQKFTSTGKLLMEIDWNRGIMDGMKIVYRNGIKVAEIPYINGQKQGIETHYDDLGNLTAEILWKNDKKHGCSKFFTDETIEEEWFYKGQTVDREKFDLSVQREQIIAELSGIAR